MNDKTKTLAATTILIVVFFLILVAVILSITGKKVVSPIPEESMLKIIFISPTPPGVPSASPSAQTQLSPKPTSR